MSHLEEGRHFVAATTSPETDSATDCAHRHPTFSGALDCAKKRGYREVWSVELRLEKRRRRAVTRVGP